MVLMFVSETSLPRQIEEVDKFVRSIANSVQQIFGTNMLLCLRLFLHSLQGGCLCRSKAACVHVAQPFLLLSAFNSEGGVLEDFR